MKMSVVVLMSLAILLGGPGAFAQSSTSGSQKLSAAELRQDFSLLRDTLQKIHPGIYRYVKKQNLDRILDSCYGSIQDSMTVPDFYALIRFVIASLEDGHSNCRLSKDVEGQYYSAVKVFPAMVMFIHHHAYIYCSKQNDSLAGAEILELNGQPMDRIIDRLFRYVPSDAGIESRKNWEIPEYFNLLFNVVYGSQKDYALVYRGRNGKVGRTMLAPGLLAEFMCKPPSIFKRPTRYLTLDYQPGNIAVLTIKTFFTGYLSQTGESFPGFLDSAFSDIRRQGVRKLIIDIRRNQGGDDVNGALLYAYVAQGPFRYYDSLKTVKEKFNEDRHPNLKIQLPKPNAFDGKLFILADGRSFSASSEFSSIVKSNGRGQFIGEENGGGYYGNTSGGDEEVVLPASQITCRIPLLCYFLAVKKLKNGELEITPDFPVYRTIGDIIDDTDSQLKRALQIVSTIK